MGGGTKGMTPWLTSAYYHIMLVFVRIQMFALPHPIGKAVKWKTWWSGTERNGAGHKFSEAGVKEKASEMGSSPPVKFTHASAPSPISVPFYSNSCPILLFCASSPGAHTLLRGSVSAIGERGWRLYVYMSGHQCAWSLPAQDFHYILVNLLVIKLCFIALICILFTTCSHFFFKWLLFHFLKIFIF